MSVPPEKVATTFPLIGDLTCANCGHFEKFHPFKKVNLNFIQKKEISESNPQFIQTACLDWCELDCSGFVQKTITIFV